MATKYVSTTGSNGNNGDTTGTPYQTIAYGMGQVGSGDSLLLKRGDIFPADHYVAETNVTFGAYGTGNNPKISGFVTTSSWTNEGGGIWSFTDAGLPTLLNVVTIDGVFRPRRIITGANYRTFTAHTGTGIGTITDATLSNSPSYSGAEIVIRKRHWVLDRGIVTSHTSGVITYGALTGHVGSGSYTPLDGYGYFFQNHINLLTTFGDWMYDGSAKKISMYFGAANPSSYVIKLSKTFRGFSIADSSGCTFQDIDVEGINQWGFLQGGNNTSFRRMNFTFCGEHAIYLTSTTGVTVDSCTFTDMANNAVTGDGGCSGWTVTNNILTRIHNWTGAGGSNDTKGIGIVVLGDSLTCTNNSITDIGWTGIYYRGNGCVVNNNKVDHFCYSKDDGGALYTFEGTTITNSVRRSVKGNTLLNGTGAGLGTADGDNKAFAIYIDEKASQIDVEDNFVAFCNKGMFMHNAFNIGIVNNFFYKNSDGIYIRTFDTGEPSSNIALSGNVVLGTTTQRLLIHDSAGSSNSAWGSSNNNKFYSPDSTPFTTRINEGSFTTQTLASWRTATSKDAASTLATYTGETYRYNSTESSGAQSLPGTFIDTAGTTYTNSITLAAHRGNILFYVSGGGTSKFVVNSSRFVVNGGKLIVNG